MRLIMTVKMAKMAVISNKLTYNEDIHLSCLENSECTAWTTIFQSRNLSKYDKTMMTMEFEEKLPWIEIDAPLANKNNDDANDIGW